MKTLHTYRCCELYHSCSSGLYNARYAEVQTRYIWSCARGHCRCRKAQLEPHSREISSSRRFVPVILHRETTTGQLTPACCKPRREVGEERRTVRHTFTAAWLSFPTGRGRVQGQAPCPRQASFSVSHHRVHFDSHLEREFGSLFFLCKGCGVHVLGAGVTLDKGYGL